MWVGEITLNGESLSGFGSLNLENPFIYQAREGEKKLKLNGITKWNSNRTHKM